jgi:HPt (histidine-containing phosphotransfer) domain-containing protein
MSTAIDQDTFQTFLLVVGGDEPEVVQEFIDLFIQDSEKLLTEIRQAVEQQDAASLVKSAHSLKSSSAQLGALTLSDYCQTLELMGRDERLDGSEAVLHNAEAENQRVREAFMNMQR